MADLVHRTPSEQISNLKARLSGLRHHADATAASMEQKLTAGVAAFVCGAWAKSRRTTGTTPETQALPTIAGLPPLALYGAVGLLAGSMVGGRVGEIAESAGTGLLCAYAYEWGAQ